MPKVPEYSRRVSPISTVPQSSVSLTPETPSALKPVTDAVSNLLNQKGQIEFDELKEANETWETEAKAAFIKQRNNDILDPDTGMMSAKYKGKNSLEARAYMEESSKKFSDGYSQNASNEFQKQALQRIISNDSLSRSQAVAQHIGSEMPKYQAQTNNAAIKEYLDDTYHNPANAAQNLKEIKGLAAKQADLKGLQGEAKKGFMKGIMSGAHLNVLSSFADNKDYGGAEDYLKKNKKYLTAKDAAVADRMTHEVTILGKAQDNADALRSQASTRGEVIKGAESISDPDERKATLAVLRQAHRDEDSAIKADQESIYESATKMIDSGRAVPASMTARLETRYRDLLTERLSGKSRKSSDVSAYIKLDNMGQDEMASLSPVDFELASSRLTPADRKIFLKRFSLAQSGSPEFGFEKQVDGFIKDRIVSLGWAEDYSELSKGESAVFYGRLKGLVDLEIQREKNTTGKKNLPLESVRKIIGNVIGHQVTKPGGWFSDDERIHTLDPIIDDEDFVIPKNQCHSSNETGVGSIR